MLGLKLQMVLSIAGAIVLSVILFGVSYLLTPNVDTLPMPKPLILHQIIMGLSWIGLSALLAFFIVGVGLVIHRVRNKKPLEDFGVDAEFVDPGSNDA